MSLFKLRKKAISRTLTVAVVIIVIIIIAVAGAAVYYAGLSTKTNYTQSTSNNSTTSGTNTGSSSSSTGTGTGTTSTTGNTTSGGQLSTLVIDDETWPTGNLNQLNAIGAIPYPNWLTYTVYQSLVTVNGTMLYQNGTVQALPMLADAWNSSADGKTWSFHLRQGVQFSNGDPLNSYQVWGEMYGFYYLSANTSGWAVGYNVFNMNTANFGPATIALMNQSGLINPNSQLMSVMSNNTWPIYVNGPQYINFNLKAAFQWFPEMWVQFTGLIFDTQFLLEHGGFGTPGSFNTYFDLNPIPGTGPYQVTQVSANSFVQFTQSSTYWGKNLTAAEIRANPYLDPGHVKNVIVRTKTDDVARYVDLSSGSAQIAAIVSQDWPQVINNPSKYAYYQMPNSADNIVGLAMNTQRYPTNITAVRQAIVHAINYSDVSNTAFLGTQGGGLTPWMGPEYPGETQLYDLGNLPPYQYNVTLAKQILTNAGIDPTTLPPIEFRVISGCGTCINTAQVVQADLAAIGISVNVEVTLPSQYGPPLVAGSGTYQQELNESQTIAQMSWLGTATFAPDEPTPIDSWIVWVSNRTSANNWAIYYNPTVQACIDSMTNGTSQASLVTKCTAAQQQIYTDAPYVWLGSVKLFIGGGSIVWDKNVVSGFLADPVFSGQSETAIFNTVTFTNGQ